MDYLLGVHDRINAISAYQQVESYHNRSPSPCNILVATKINTTTTTSKSSDAWFFLRSIPEVAALYQNSRENHLPLAFRDLLDDLPLSQIYEMETRKTLVEREEWFVWFTRHMERCAQEKGICTEQLANEIHRWGVYCLQRIHEIFTNIEADFKVERRIWETALQFQTPARSLSASLIPEWNVTRRSCSASPLRIRSVTTTTNTIPELIGPLLNWQPLFDAESSGSPSDEEGPAMCIASA